MKRKIRPFFIAVAPGTLFSLVLLGLSSSNKWGPRRFTLFDDAMISMSYAKTLATTGEFVWFVDAPRVEGFTNPLWTSWMAVIHLLGFSGSNAALVVSLTGIALLIGTSWLLFDLMLKSEAHASIESAIVASSVFLMYPTVYWSLRGMEVGLLSFLTMFLVRNVISQSQSSTRILSFSTATAMCLGVATRFDFIVVCIVAIIGLTTWGEDRKLRIFFTYTAVSMGSLLLVVVIQKMYWGSWLPNTYHLKMDGVPALERVGRGIASSMKMLAIGIVVVSTLLLSLRVKTIARRIVLLCGSMFLAVSAYAIYIGGDAWEDQMVNRFFATILPLLPAIVVLGFSFPRCKTHLKLILPLLVVASIGYGAGVNPFGINVKYSLGALLATAIGTILVAALTQLKLGNLHILPSVAILLTVIAPISGIPFQRHIKSNDILGVKTNLYVTEIVENLVPAVSSTAVIATVWAGVPAYYTNRPMIDLLGKNDELIAHSSPKGEFFPGHNKWNYDHSIGRLRPDVIFQTYTRGLENNLAEKIRSWGYEKFCRPVEPFPIDGIYFKIGSKNIKWNELSQCSVP